MTDRCEAMDEDLGLNRARREVTQNDIDRREKAKQDYQEQIKKALDKPYYAVTRYE